MTQDVRKDELVFILWTSCIYCISRQWVSTNKTFMFSDQDPKLKLLYPRGVSHSLQTVFLFFLTFCSVLMKGGIGLEILLCNSCSCNRNFLSACSLIMKIGHWNIGVRRQKSEFAMPMPCTWVLLCLTSSKQISSPEMAPFVKNHLRLILFAFTLWKCS